jgi:hypothetical protein
MTPGAEQSRIVIARSTCDEAIQASPHHWIASLRFARNDEPEQA